MSLCVVVVFLFLLLLCCVFFFLLFLFVGGRVGSPVVAFAKERKYISEMIGSERNRRPVVGKIVSEEKKKVAIFRWLVFLALFCAAILCGTLSYFILKKTEDKNFKKHFKSTATQLKKSIAAMVQKYHYAVDQLAVIATTKYNQDSSWPNISFDQYYLLDNSFQNLTGSTSSSSILPIVYPDEIGAFESFAMAFLKTQTFMAFYNQSYLAAGGVWRYDSDGKPIHDTTGVTYFSDRHIFVPILNSPLALIEAGLVLGNLHMVPQAGRAMDDCLECVEQGYESCASLTDFLIGTNYEVYASASIYRPIFSRNRNSLNSSSKVLGFSTIGFDWPTELRRLSFDVLGIDCVLSSLTLVTDDEGSKSHTYYMHDGGARYRGSGDLHNTKYTNMRVSVPLSLVGSHATDSAAFILNMYPTDSYRESFNTNTPLYTSVGLVGMILFTSVVFFSYDSLVKEDVREKNHILRVKRDFVRFISHEIRTPLNTVSVGITLLEEGLQAMRMREKRLFDDSTVKESNSNPAPAKNDPIILRAMSQSPESTNSSLYIASDMSLLDMIELTEDVQNSTGVAVEVLNDLLNFDKLEAGELHIARDTVPIWELVSNVVKSFKIQAHQKKIAMTLEFISPAKSCDAEVFNPQTVCVLGDKFKLAHVIRNMMSNALKFTDKHGSVIVTASLKSSQEMMVKSASDIHLTSIGNARCSLCDCVSSAPPSPPPSPSIHSSKRISSTSSEAAFFPLDTLQVAVRDSGFGLSRAQLEELFQDGKQFDPNKLQAGQGSGLGLYLSQKIANLHGGYMWAESKGENKGATFLLSLPILMVQPLPTSPTSTQRRPNELIREESNIKQPSDVVDVDKVEEEKEAPKCPGRILVVDDASSNRKIVCRALRSRGFECAEARDGQECIKMVRNLANTSISSAASPSDETAIEFECIIMDFEMPVLNGPDATVALRDMGFTRPIVGLTGNVMQEDIQHFLDSGADIVLCKPLDINEFMKTYKQLVECSV